MEIYKLVFSVIWLIAWIFMSCCRNNCPLSILFRNYSNNISTTKFPYCSENLGSISFQIILTTWHPDWFDSFLLSVQHPMYFQTWSARIQLTHLNAQRKFKYELYSSSLLTNFNKNVFMLILHPETKFNHWYIILVNHVYINRSYIPWCASF